MKKFIGKIVILVILLFPFKVLAQDSDYQIGGSDVLKITVFDYPDLSTTVRVSKEGKITFPLLGEVDVNGLTALAASKKITGLLAKGIIVNPQVNVFIEQYKLRRVTVIGEVAKPGQYELAVNEPTYVADIISNSLGLTKDAGERLTILRREKNGSKKIDVNLTKLLYDGDLSQNVELQEGDILTIQRAGYFYIYGEVNRAGYYKIEPGMSVIKAISKAEGLTPLASTRGIRLIRGIKGKDTTINVELNNPVLTGENFFKNGDMAQDIKVDNEDVIYVPKAPYFYVYGEVKNPGFYKLEPDLTVINALSMAGGVTDRASTSRISILRKSEDKKISLDAKLEHPIQEEDIIIVKESIF